MTSCKNPLAQINFRIPSASAGDSQRGLHSPRHKPWFETGAAPVRFDWVKLERSLQWGAFQRLVRLLQQRDNDLLVIVGPFNEHMVEEQNGTRYQELKDLLDAALMQRKQGQAG